MVYTQDLKSCGPKDREGSSPSLGTSAEQNFLLGKNWNCRMYSVYILESLRKKGKTYVGLTIKDLEVRIKEHNKGLSRYTKAYIP